MAAIQLGIGQSITSVSGKPKRDLLLQDFSIVETVFFPKFVSQYLLNTLLWFIQVQTNVLKIEIGSIQCIKLTILYSFNQNPPVYF